MKVISKGERMPGDRIWNGTCTECGSFMTETEDNITNQTHHPAPAGNDPREHAYTSAQMKCPVCYTPFTMVQTSGYDVK